MSRAAAGSTQTRVSLDGVTLDQPLIELIDDRREHAVEVVLGAQQAPRAGL